MMIIDDIFYYLEKYALSAFIIAAFTAIFSHFFISQKNKDIGKFDYIKHMVMLMISVGYAYMIVGITLLSRETDTIRYVNLKLFSAIYANRTIIKYFVENILMFIPYGVIYGIEHGERNDFNSTFIINRAVFTSVMIEACQYITARGRTEADDILTNTIGAVIGWQIVRLAVFILKRKEATQERI